MHHKKLLEVITVQAEAICTISVCVYSYIYTTYVCICACVSVPECVVCACVCMHVCVCQICVPGFVKIYSSINIQPV